MASNLKITSILLSVAVSACGSIHSNVSDAAFVTTQSGTDVQVLQAWRAEVVSLDIARCDGADPVVGSHVTKDCTQQGMALTRATWANQDSPALNNWLMDVFNSHGYIGSRYSSGNIVEMRALVKRLVLDSPVFSGIGFHFRNMLQNEVKFISKSKLHIVSEGDVTLLENGEKAAVLRFTLFMPGQTGNSGTGWSMNSVEFKPFAQFDVDGQTFQKWDSASQNYRIYRAQNGGGRQQITSFDRQDELLVK